MRGPRAKLPASALADLFSRRKNPYKDSAPYNPEEWTVTLFAVPVATVIAGFLAW
jgi:hypothetical protein